MGLEHFRGKIMRHIAAKDVNISTLRRGIKQGIDWITTEGIAQSIWRKVGSVRDYLGIKGYVVTKYAVDMPSLTEWSPKITTETKIFDFPYKSQFHLLTSSDLSSTASYPRLLCPRDQTLIATFTGPTIAPGKGKNLPNNGYYHHGEIDTIAFADTNPPGERRGAIYIPEENNDILLVDDEIKWEIVKGRFKKCQALVGTSYYFEGGDSIQFHIANNKPKDRNYLAYLFQYFVTDDNKSRTGYFQTNGIINRPLVFEILSDHILSQRGNLSIATEMEMVGSHINSFNPSTDEMDTFGNGAMKRRDHYLVTIPK